MKQALSKKNLLRCAVFVITLGILAGSLWYFVEETFVDRSLLSGVPCQAPCWQGIVPGETTSSEAMEILRSLPFVRADSLQEAGSKEWGGVTWEGRVSNRPGIPTGISWQIDIVQEIGLGLAYELTIEEVIEVYGTPQAIKAGGGGVPEHWYFIVDLYYPDKGLQFKAYTSEYSSLIEPETEIGGVYYYVPGSLEDRLLMLYGNLEPSPQEIFDHITSLVRPWNGYGDLFEKYYETPNDLIFEKHYETETPDDLIP